MKNSSLVDESYMSETTTKRNQDEDFVEEVSSSKGMKLSTSANEEREGSESITVLQAIN